MAGGSMAGGSNAKRSFLFGPLVIGSLRPAVDSLGADAIQLRYPLKRDVPKAHASKAMNEITAALQYLEISMSVYNKSEVLEEVRRILPDVRVVAVTGSAKITYPPEHRAGSSWLCNAMGIDVKMPEICLYE
jgi:hypothetical protein